MIAIVIGRKRSEAKATAMAMALQAAPAAIEAKNSTCEGPAQTRMVESTATSTG
ncbi:hypothetical protein D3C87_1992480 [compost metagenome]